MPGDRSAPPLNGHPHVRWPHLASADADAVRDHAAALLAAGVDDRILAREAVGCWMNGHVSVGLRLAVAVRGHGDHRQDRYLRREAIRLALVLIEEVSAIDVAALMGYGLVPPLPDDADLAAMIAILVDRPRIR